MIEEEIRKHAIGDKIRALRREKKWGLVELGRQSGFSPALISKIETGKLIPPLPTLLRIAMVFSVGLDHFFVEEPASPMVAVSRRRDGSREILSVANAKLKADIHLLGAEPRELCSATAGTAFLYVLSGRIRAAVGAEAWNMEEGDCVTFSLHLMRSFCALDEGARALLLIVV